MTNTPWGQPFLEGCEFGWPGEPDPERQVDPNTPDGLVGAIGRALADQVTSRSVHGSMESYDLGDLDLTEDDADDHAEDDGASPEKEPES